MKKILITILLIILINPLIAKKIIPFPELLKPETISIDENQIYITEGASIYIYSLKDFKFKKKFGKEGSGPQEFKMPQSGLLTIDVQTNDIIVNSLAKISYFSKDGKFKKEIKNNIGITIMLQVLGNGFAGIGFPGDNKMIYRSLNLYDSNLNKSKEICKMKHDFQLGKGTRVLPTPYPFVSYNNKLYITWENDFIIKVYNNKGEKLFSIKQNYDKLNVKKEHKKGITHWYKTDIRTARYFEFLKPLIFPAYFPAIRYIYINENKIYVLTYKQKDNQSEFYIFNLKGKLIKKKFLPLIEKNAIETYPYVINKGKLYQLVDNEDKEEWELLITKI
jgi:hypothetical protein